jgi:hypothetical protein
VHCDRRGVGECPEVLHNMDHIFVEVFAVGRREVEGNSELQEEIGERQCSRSKWMSDRSSRSRWVRGDVGLWGQTAVVV